MQAALARSVEQSPTVPLSPSSSIRFVTLTQRVALEAAGEGGAVVARVESLGAEARGRLAELVDEAIEKALSARAAPPAGIARDFDAAMSDKLYRARKVGANALVVALGPLRGAASSKGALDAADTETLRALARATRGRPLTLLLDASDAGIDAHAYPVPLASLLASKTLPPIANVIESSPATSTPSPTATSEDSPKPSPNPVPMPGEPDPTPDPDPEPPGEPVVELEAKHAAGASVAKPDESWRHWSLQLTAARGPQPIMVLERIFVESYLPLANALARGLDDARARSARDEFRAAFSKSYTDSCPTFAATGKRPKMVLDAIDLAHKSARLHGARGAHVLVVDGMRADVGAIAKRRCVEVLSSRARLTDDLLLWSALPTTTPRQLLALARGVDALRLPPDEEVETDSLRGRTAEVIRRIRVGSRDVYKLDLVESRVREAQGHVLDALDAIGLATGDVIGRHAASLPARSLLFVCGDHGFSIERDGSTRQGGASPEEVLVPAFALLVADVH